jgi:predicted  nucleic acid-binding Zn-ribbon protein
VVSLDEIKSVQAFLRSQSEDAAKVEGSEDYMDMDELLNAVLIGHKSKLDKEFELRPVDTPSEVAELRRKLQRILREKDDDSEFFNAKIRQLKRQLKDAESEKAELEEAVQKADAQKQRLEKFYRNKMGLDAPADKAGTNELLTEMSVLQRRLEFLEEQAEERNKQMVNEHAPCRREIQRLQQELTEERDLRSNVINKKNKEIAYFKNELDGLLADIASTSTDSV